MKKESREEFKGNDEKAIRPLGWVGLDIGFFPTSDIYSWNLFWPIAYSLKLFEKFGIDETPPMIMINGIVGIFLK